jgi:hypothetical protein
VDGLRDTCPGQPERKAHGHRDSRETLRLHLATILPASVSVGFKANRGQFAIQTFRLDIGQAIAYKEGTAR